jgi:hypothetical protein
MLAGAKVRPVARVAITACLALGAASLVLPGFAGAQTIVKQDQQIDSLDPGIKLFLRRKMTERNTQFTDSNIIPFLHGATSPSICDFDLPIRIIPGPTCW